jgi:hypothetical protein
LYIHFPSDALSPTAQPLNLAKQTHRASILAEREAVTCAQFSMERAIESVKKMAVFLTGLARQRRARLSRHRCVKKSGQTINVEKRRQVMMPIDGLSSGWRSRSSTADRYYAEFLIMPSASQSVPPHRTTQADFFCPSP